MILPLPWLKMGQSKKKIEEEKIKYEGKDKYNEMCKEQKSTNLSMGELKSIDSKLSSLEDDYARFQSN